jgi:hypothetical protein
MKAKSEDLIELIEEVDEHITTTACCMLEMHGIFKTRYQTEQEHNWHT